MTSALSDYLISVHKTYPVDMVVIHSKVKMSQRLAAVCNSLFAFLGRVLQYAMSFTETHNLQQLGFLLSDDELVFLSVTAES